MTLAQTQNYEELILEVFDDEASNWRKIAGIKNVTVTRTANVDSAEAPDVDDEALPYEVLKSVRSLEVSISGDGVYARQSSSFIKNWFYSAIPKLVRTTYQDVVENGGTGDIEGEEGMAILSSLSNERSKENVITTADIELQFNGTPRLIEKQASGEAA